MRIRGGNLPASVLHWCGGLSLVTGMFMPVCGNGMQAGCDEMKSAGGGEDMIEDTIRAVKEAEAKADTLIADAGKQADTIKKEAETQALKLIEDAKEAAKKAVSDALNKARAAGEEKLQAADAEAAKEAEALKAEAAGKKDTAVSAVIDALLK